jgi:excisionase family DNA binding protein
MTEATDAPDTLAYSPAAAAKAVGRSHSRIKKAIREKELQAAKDGRKTLVTRAELQRWLATLPTIGRQPVQEPAHAVADAKARQPERGRAYAPSLKPRPAFDTIESKQPRR